LFLGKRSQQTTLPNALGALSIGERRVKKSKRFIVEKKAMTGPENSLVSNLKKGKETNTPPLLIEERDKEFHAQHHYVHHKVEDARRREFLTTRP